MNKIEFIKALEGINKTYKTSQKVYHLVSVTKNKIKLQDPSKHLSFDVPIDALYNAYLELKNKGYKVADVKLYVGKDAASASASLLKHMNSTISLLVRLAKYIANNEYDPLQDKEIYLGSYDDILHESNISQLEGYAQLYDMPNKLWCKNTNIMADRIYNFAIDNITEWLYDIPVDDLIYIKELAKEDDTPLQYLPEFPHPMIPILLGIAHDSSSDNGDSFDDPYTTVPTLWTLLLNISMR